MQCFEYPSAPVHPSDLSRRKSWKEVSEVVQRWFMMHRITCWGGQCVRQHLTALTAHCLHLTEGTIPQYS